MSNKPNHSHWLIAHEVNDDGDAVINSYTVACGVPWIATVATTDEEWWRDDFHDGFTCPEYASIKYPDCLASEVFKQVQIEIEVGYNGNALEWWNARKRFLLEQRGKKDVQANPGSE